VAVRCVPEELWEGWSKTLTRAGTLATREQDAMLETVYEDMERDLVVGLQPLTISQASIST